MRYDYGSIVELSVKSKGADLSEYPVSISLNPGGQPQGLLALTLLNLAGPFMDRAFNYYSYVAQGKAPRSEPPPERPEYPGKVNYVGKWEHDPVGCWAYPTFPGGLNEIPPYTVFLLAKLGDSYEAYLALSSGQLTGFIGPGLRLIIFTGRPSQGIKGWPLVIGASKDPYEAIDNAVKLASIVAPIKHRKSKAKPKFMNGLGWCSWNALLTDDLSHESAIRIIKGLMDKGVPIRWIIIDDGWQELRNGSLNNVKPDLSKFPRGFKALVNELKALGIEDAGLWFTINMYWRGVTEDFLNSLGVEGYKTGAGYVPMPNLDSAFRLYDTWFRILKSEGFSFAKVDNQWIVHRLYWGFANDAEASRAVELALQLAAASNGIDILNCMDMSPGNYSNYALSNVMRASQDYIPMWRADAKLHTLWNTYNSLLYNHFAYPDYDMWMSYDPSARLIAVTRIFSGGPVYITDREPEKTNVELIKWITLSNGEVVRVNEPALPTRDILFRDPYNEAVLLKLASAVNGYPVIAFMNINRGGLRISEEFRLSNMPMELSSKYVYYKVISGEWGIIEANGSVKVELNELEVEIVVLAPLINGNAVIGIMEKALPPYPLEFIKIDSKIMVRTKDAGTLLYVRDNTLGKVNVKVGSIIETSQ
ncbi:MAG: Sip1-related alpha-galactosidase [Vulcanisaeta sp.]|uniref:Sip1-related alpha-galactosidase n=1 Tax=Vulcanisaeta sp. TaxID=2020871 RepID=UPI003D0CB6FE